MSRIAGVFYPDFRPVPERDQKYLSGMRAHRGAGEPRIFQAAGVLMAQASSRFDYPRNGAPAQDPDAGFCCWDGRLDNHRDVELRFPRESLPAGANAAMAALRQYAAEGTGGLRQLIGDWSLALWDARARVIVLASDYAGVRPLYYFSGPDRFCWSSSLAHLVEWLGGGELDERYAARFLLSRTVPRLTPWRGVYSLQPGHAVTLQPEGPSPAAFWRPPVDQELRLADERDYQEALRALFREAVAVRAGSHSRVCSELSGGLDSSSVVCMLSRLLEPESKPVTFSFVHEKSRDLPYIGEVEKACGISGLHLDLKDCPLVTVDQTGDAAPSWWQPRLQLVARRMEELGSGVLLTGQMGDFVMGNLGDDSEQVADCLERREYRNALREGFAWSQALEIPIYQVLWRAARTAYFSWTAPSISDAWDGPTGQFTSADSMTSWARGLAAEDQGPAAPPECWQQAMPSRRRRLRMLMHTLQGRALQTPETLEHLHYTHPYAHRPLVEFMLTIPPGQVCRPGEPRRLMRRAFAPFLPAAVARRQSKALYGIPFREALLPMAAAILAEPARIRSVELGYLERENLLQRLQRFTQGLEANDLQLRQVLLFEFWLRGRETRRDHSLQGATTSTLVPCPGELQTEKVAPI